MITKAKPGLKLKVEVETVQEVLNELANYCKDILTGKSKMDSSFFSTKAEATRLNTACEKGSTMEVLMLLKSFHGEPSPRKYIDRLEATISKQEATNVIAPTTANTNDVTDQKSPEKIETPSKDEKTGEKDDDSKSTADLIRELMLEIKSHPKCNGESWTDLRIRDCCERVLKGIPGAGQDLKNLLSLTNDKVGQKFSSSLEELMWEAWSDEHLQWNTGSFRPVYVPARQELDGNEITVVGEFQWVDPAILKPHPRIHNLYKMRTELLKSIEGIMNESGFDTRYPIQVVIIDGVFHIWDGFTRHKASINTKQKKVYIQISKFLTVEELLLACVRNQALRRNNDDPTTLRSIELLDELETAKAKERQKRKAVLSGQACPDKGSTNQKIAMIIGKSETTVKHARKVLACPEYKEKVLAGELSINSAYELIMENERAKSASSVSESAAIKNPEFAASEHVTSEPSSPQIPKEQCASKPAVEKSMPTSESPSLFTVTDAESVPYGEDENGEDSYLIPGSMIAAFIKHAQESGIPVIRAWLADCDTKTASFIKHLLDKRIGGAK